MISQNAIVETEQIGQDVSIGDFSIIRSNVKIADGVIIHPHVIIESGVEIGEYVEIYPGTIIGKTPKGAGATARPIEFRPFVSIGKNCALGPNAVIFYDVEIGHNTLVGDGASVREQCRIGHHCILGRYVTVNYNTTIGNRCRIMDLSHITGHTIIQDNVFISVHVSTTNDNHIRNREYSEDKIIGPVIEAGATIGAGACLLPGVKIGEGAFVGSNAVVTEDVHPYDLVMGIPARVARHLTQDKQTD